MPGQVAPVADEREGLLAYLDQQRHVLRVAAYGLTDEQARATPTPSALSVGGLVKHVAQTEQGWMDTVLQRERDGADGGEAAYEDGFRLLEGETLADVLAFYDEVAAETREVVAGLGLDHPVPVPPAPWNPTDVDAWSLRWVLLHLIEETARHAGHADIVREAVDGATAFALLAAAEGWPETPWLSPWRPDDG
ncbi:MAG: DinB family protein [Acidimicrobiia bacterium]|nr:DinB family protein [Acidimicrobiia bacterium]